MNPQGRPPRVQARFLELAGRPDGLTIDEADGVEKRQFEQAAWKLHRTGRVFRLRAGYRKFRFFTSKADMDRYAIEHPIAPIPPAPTPKPKAHQKPVIHAPARPMPGGPARLPGPLVFTAATKFTYGVSPSNPTRTNTHSE